MTTFSASMPLEAPTMPSEEILRSLSTIMSAGIPNAHATVHTEDILAASLLGLASGSSPALNPRDMLSAGA